MCCSFIHSFTLLREDTRYTSVDERREERESLWRVVESIARARSLVEEDASWSLDDDDDDDDFDASIEPSFLCSDDDVA